MSNVTNLDEYRRRAPRKIIVLADYSTFDSGAMLLELTPEGASELGMANDAHVLFDENGTPNPDFVKCISWIGDVRESE